MKVILPEQVAVELRLANYGSRALAYILDWLIRWTFTILLILAFLISLGMLKGIADVSSYVNRVLESIQNFTSIDSTFALLLALGLFVVFVIQWSYTIYFEVAHEGVTPGKRLMGLRVLDEQGLPLSFRASFLRTVFLLVDLLPVLGFVGLTSMIVTKRSQRLGDLIASTVVTYDDREIATHRTGTDFSLPYEHYRLLERFVARAPELRIDAKHVAAQELKQVLTPYVRDVPEAEDLAWLQWVLVHSYPEKQSETVTR